MKNSTIKKALINFAIAASIITVGINNAQAQSKPLTKMEQEKKSTVVHASSLREMYGFTEDGQENNLEMVLALYNDINYAYIAKDPALKEKLVFEFLDDLRENGYKVPKKIKTNDYFEPYNFILDMKVYLNKSGFIIPADQVGKGLTSYAGK